MSKRSMIALVSCIAVLGALPLTGCASEPEPAVETPPAAEQPAAEAPTAEAPAAHEAPDGMEDVTELKTDDLVVGDGAEAKEGDSVTVNYTGWLTDGTKFDSSLDSGQPLPFTLGAGEVIPGWDEGVQGMKIGGSRVLTVPPAMGYGEQGYPPVIPPNATLVFQVDLLAVN